MIEFRVLTPDDVPLVLPLVREFEAAIDHPVIRVESRAYLANWTKFLELDLGVIVAAVDGETVAGAISGFVVPYDLNGETIAQENFWYVSPVYRSTGLGRALVTLFERHATARGAKRISLGAIGHLPSVDALLNAMGYAPFETTWFKVVE